MVKDGVVSRSCSGCPAGRGLPQGAHPGGVVCAIRGFQVTHGAAAARPGTRNLLLERLLTPRRASRPAVGRARVVREGTEYRLGRVAGRGAPDARRAATPFRPDPLHLLNAPRVRWGPERGSVPRHGALTVYGWAIQSAGRECPGDSRPAVYVPGGRMTCCRRISSLDPTHELGTLGRNSV